MGGFTPIEGGRTLDQFGGTFGRRFGMEKRFGFCWGAAYDHNNRGIDDVEAVPGVFDFGTATASDFEPCVFGCGDP